MNRDELREKLAKQLYEWIDDGWEWREITKTSRDVYRSKADSILSILAHELEKARFWDEHVESLPEIANNIKQLRAAAEKWRKVKEIAKRNWYDGYPCDGCPVENCCDSADSLCGQADALVQALTGKEPR